MALPIQDWIIAVLDLVLGVRRNAGGDAAPDKRLAEPDRTIGAIREQAARGWQRLDHRCSGLVIVGLAFGEIEQQRTAIAVADDLKLGRQAASAASDTSG